MRLFDAIVQRGFAWADCNVQPPELLTLQTSIAALPTRYILDNLASEACNNLLLCEGLFDAGGDLLRFPAQNFWLELWSDSATEVDRKRRKIGALVDCEEQGRAGCVTHFFEDSRGEPKIIPIRTYFNFDTPAAASKDPRHLTVRHRDFAHLTPLLDHVSLVVDDSWFGHAVRDERFPLQRRLKDYVEGMWFDLPVALSFAAMLNSPGIVQEQPSELRRLNGARARRGKPILLDHIEISLNLAAKRRVSEFVGSGGHRLPPRLHHVRGHLVERAGKTFWRAAHLRGDSNFAMVSKTVRVTSQSTSAERRSG